MRKSLLIALGLALVIWFVWSLCARVQDRQAQLRDFKADVVASGFTLAVAPRNPSIKDEMSGFSTETTTLEALVVVRGCTVELDRDYDEQEATAVSRQGRRIEAYELDEAMKRGDDEVEIDDAPPSPTPAQVEQYLRSRAGTFKYCLAA